jgi:hypothetical protein
LSFDYKALAHQKNKLFSDKKLKNKRMNFKKGDKVRFLNDVGGGVVVRIIDNKMVEILSEDDFEVPVLASELVKISTHEQNAFADDKEEDEFEFENVRQMQEAEDRETNWEDDEEESFENSIIEIEGNDELKLYLAILPSNADKPSDSDMDLYLINDSNYQAQAIVSEVDGDFATMQWNNPLEANTKLKIASYAQNQLGTFPTLRFQFLFFRYGRFESIAPLEKDITIRAQKFYKKGSFVENEFFEADAIVIKINEDDLSAVVNQYSDQDIKKMAKEKNEFDAHTQRLEQKFKVKTSNFGIKEVDLHIHELIDNYVGMSNAEMLNIQMETFHKELSHGLKNNEIKKMVFIHGVGAGTLKNELRKSLSKDYPQLYFQDASFKEYGFGATLIIIRRG